MMQRPSVDADLQAELQAAAAGAGCELLHAEWKGGVLRLFLDREAGVTLSDCEAVSRHASALLDVAGFGRGRYTLEVSTPGLDRQLYRPADYARFTGRKVRVTFIDPATGRKRTVVGRLQAFRPSPGGEDGEIDLDGLERGDALRLALHSIQLARLEVEL